MGIASRQIAWAIERALEKILKAGKMPSLQELLRAVPAQLGPHGPGFPILRLRPAKPHQPAIAEHWNAMVEELRADLELLFAEHHAQAQDILAAFDWTETEHRALARRLHELEQILDRMLLLNRHAAGYVATAGDRFSNLNQVDTSKTTAWVDLVHHQVTPPIRRGVSRVIDLAGARFTAEVIEPAEDLRVPELTKPLTDPAMALDGRLDTAWIQQIVTTRAGPAAVRFEVDLGTLSEAPVTEIGVSPHAMPGSMVEVHITEDGIVWRLVGAKTYQAEAELAFPVGQAIRGCRVVVRQSAPDNTLATDPDAQDKSVTYFEHHIGIEQIAWRVLAYENKAVLVSTALTPLDASGRPVAVGQVSLQVDEIRHTGDIRYAISTDGETWFPIVPLHRATSTQEAVVDFRTISSPHTVTASAASLSSDRRVHHQGLDFWRLADLPIPSDRVLVPETVEMVAGYRQMALYQYVYDKTPDEVDPWTGTELPSLTHWVQLPPGLRFSDDVTLRFINVSTTQLTIPHPQANVHSRLVGRFRSAKSQQVRLYLELISGANDIGATWYVGTSKVASQRIAVRRPWIVTANLAEGQNQLQLLLVCPHPRTSGDLVLTVGIVQGEGVVAPLLQLDTELIGGDRPLTALAPFDLFYRTPERAYDRFAVDVETASIYIPGIARQMGINYRIRYQTRATDVPTQLYFRAELEKPPEALLPPILQSYTLMVTP